jgi:hypothetical protein
MTEKGKRTRTINGKEFARDIRSGMSDLGIEPQIWLNLDGP